MEPAYQRGDILFLTNWEDKLEAGDIIVYQFGDDIPIVHRLISIQSMGNDDYKILTKGDNNPVDDRGIYWNIDQKMIYLNKRHILGKVRANLPYVGILTILLNDYPPLKFAMIGAMFLLVMIAKDPQS